MAAPPLYYHTTPRVRVLVLVLVLGESSVSVLYEYETRAWIGWRLGGKSRVAREEKQGCRQSGVACGEGSQPARAVELG